MKMDMFDARSVSPMLIGMESQPFDDPGWIFELKLEGERCLAYLDSTGTWLAGGRSMPLLSVFPELATLNQFIRCRCILDGVLVVVDEKGLPDSGEVKRRMLTRQKTPGEQDSVLRPALFVAFDILYQSGQDISALPLMERKTMLHNLIPESGQLSIARYVETLGKAFNGQAVKRGLGSVVAKRRDSVYLPGKRTKDWIGIGQLPEADYIVCGYLDEGNRAARLVLARYDRAGKLVFKGRVTVAKASDDFARITGQEKIPVCPFGDKPPSYIDKAVWIRPVLACRVAFAARSHDGLMRQPVYKGLRLDKAVSEIRELPAID